MIKSILFWSAALIITLAAAYYQRVTGPTYPVSGKVLLNNKTVKYVLERSHSSAENYLVKISVPDPDTRGLLEWKRFKTDDEWTGVSMKYRAGVLTAEIPKQPPAGKLQYRITLAVKDNFASLPASDPVIIRFKGDVPLFILIPHILAMFGAMLLSTRTGIEAFRKSPQLKKYTMWTLAVLILGGMILGPLTQLYAFGALWTGVPFGWDLTDNKTLIALIGWIIAAVAVFRASKPKAWILSASALLLVVFLIPHSMFGSELDYKKMDKNKGNIEKVITFNHHKISTEISL